MRARSLVKWIAGLIIILVVLGYGFSRTRDLIFGTNIDIDSPKDGETVRTPLAKIVGKVGSVTKLEMNGRLILPNEDGRFEANYALVGGLNKVTITATDRFGRTHSKSLRIYHPEATEFQAIEPSEIPLSASSTPPSSTASSTTVTD